MSGVGSTSFIVTRPVLARTAEGKDVSTSIKYVTKQNIEDRANTQVILRPLFMPGHLPTLDYSHLSLISIQEVSLDTAFAFHGICTANSKNLLAPLLSSARKSKMDERMGESRSKTKLKKEEMI